MSVDQDGIQFGPSSLLAPTRYTSLSCEDLRNLPRPAWRVHNVLQEVGLAFVYGASRSGKTFLVLDLAFAVARGACWFGHKTKPAHVFYMPLEATTGIRNRVAAWEKANEGAKTEWFHVAAQTTFSLDDDSNVDGVIEWVRRDGAEGSVVIADTFARATRGMDENSSEKMGIAIAAADRIAAAIKGLVILVHHTGKDANKGLRGSSALLGAADTLIEVTRSDSGVRSWKLEKSKEGKDGLQFAFMLEAQDLYADEFGERVYSATVTPDSKADEARKADAVARLKSKGKNQRVAFDTVRRAIEHGTVVPTPQPGIAPDGATALSWKQAVELVALELDPPGDGKQDKRKQAAGRALKGLIDAGDLFGSPAEGLSGSGAVWIPIR